MFGGIRRALRRLAPTAGMLVLFVGIGLALHACLPSVAYAQDDPYYSSTITNWIGNQLAQIINFIGDAIGSLTLVIIEVIVVNVLNYNNFSSSNIVTLGWTLTRDMVNMFVVIILLVLAVKTMVKGGTSAWQQQLPKFFLGIVAVNFSRTICGLAIDASQIVMMTFVNALLSIAAGNFAQLMVLPQATTYSSATLEGATAASVSVVTLATNIANAYVKLMVQVAVMIVILLLAVAFIWRIVMLWILLIMSPLAFFSWGAMDIVKSFFGSVWSEWMSQFVAALTLGPMLAFFLYLALAASSNGNLAKTEAFPEPETRTTYGQINLEIFESTNFTGLLIALVFLVLGIRESAKTSAKMGGLAAMALNEKTGRRALSLGRRISGKALGSPLTATRVAGQAFGASGRGLAGNSLATTGFMSKTSPNLNALLQKVGRGGQKVGRGMNVLSDNRLAGAALKGLQVAESPLETSARAAKGSARLATRGLNALGAATGSGTLLAAGSFMGAKLHDFDEKESKAAKDRIAHMSEAEKNVRLQQALNGTGERTRERDADAEQLKSLLFTDENFEKSFKKTAGGQFDGYVKKVLGGYQHEADAGHLSIDEKTWNRARSKYVDVYAKVDAGKAKGFIDSEDFSGRLMRDEAAGDAAVIAALGAASTGKAEVGRVVTKLDEMNRGNYGGEKVRTAVPGAIAEQNVGNLSKLMERGGAQVLTMSHLTDTTPNAAGRPMNVAVIESIINGKAAPNEFAKDEVDAGRVTAPVVQQEFTTQVMNTQTTESIGKAFDNKQFNEGHLTRDMFDETVNTNADRAVLAMARSEAVDFSKMAASTQAQIQTQLSAMESAGGRISTTDANAIRQKMLNAGSTIPSITTINPASLSMTPAEQTQARQLFRLNPASIKDVSAAVTAAVSSSTRNDFTNTVVEGLSKEDFKKLSDAWTRETDAARKAGIKASMKTIEDALSLHIATAGSPAELKRLRGLESARTSADRYMI